MTREDELFELFNEIGIINQLAQAMLERVLPSGLSVAQFSLLNHLIRLGGDWSPARLANAFQVRRPTMTNTLGRLEAAGLVQIRPDPRDGRAKLVTITDAGVAMRDAGREALAPLLPEVAAVIAAEDVAASLPMLRRMRAALDALRD